MNRSEQKQVTALALKIFQHPEKYQTAEQTMAEGKPLMEMVLPNDKRLGDCTFGELEIVGLAYTKAADLLNTLRS